MIRWEVTLGLSFLLVAPATATGHRQKQNLFLSCDSVFTPALEVGQLVARYGSSNVSDAPLDVGEGRIETGTVLFAEDSTRRVEVLWKEVDTRRIPDQVRIRGGVSDWRTPAGLTLGQSLREVEKLNRRPFRLFGFLFDGAGIVSNWSGGNLDVDTGICALRVRLLPDDAAISAGAGLYRQVLGERSYSSGHPAMQALNPVVAEIVLVYR